MGKERLDSWKEISEYLERYIRTCQRWEKEFNLPIHRTKNSSFGTKVFAYRSELDSWMEKRFVDKKKWAILTRKTWLLPNYVLAVLLVFILVLSYLFLFNRKEKKRETTSIEANPAFWVLKGQYIAFYDIKDKFLWSGRIDNPVDQKDYYYDLERDKSGVIKEELKRSRIDFSDIDKDGKNEVICFFYHNNPEDRCITLCDNDGRRLWSRAVEFNQEYEGGKIAKDYIIQQLEFNDINNDGEEEILALWRHTRRFPSVLKIHDQKGTEILKYCHTGVLQKYLVSIVDKTQKQIFLGGTNNLLNGDAVLSVLDCQSLQNGLAPPYRVSNDLNDKRDELWMYVPKKPEIASQKYYLRFKKNEVCQIEEIKWLYVTEIHVGDNEIHIQVTLNLQKGIALYFSFGRNFQLRYVKPSAEFERNYNRLLKSGVIQTPLQTFLKNCENDVYFWSGKKWINEPVSVNY